MPIDTPRRVAEVGEFGLIDRLALVLGTPAAPNLLLGIGDDAAAWRPSADAICVATTDALVQGVHFDLATTNWEDLGWKALAENISDIAAMGCRPTYALIALALPADQSLGDVEALYRGMGECARRFGCAVVGGDVVRASELVLQVTLFGESLPTEGDRPLLERRAARPGDLLAVTGPLGGSAGGLRLLAGAVSTANETSAAGLKVAHLRPLPRVDEGVALVAAGVRCGMDISDGLLADVRHICERSGVDAEIDVDRVPRYAGLDAAFGSQALGLAMNGGEDYELVCAASPDILDHAAGLFTERGLRPLVTIGRIIPRRGPEPSVRPMGTAGESIDIDHSGWDHFGKPRNAGRGHG